MKKKIQIKISNDKDWKFIMKNITMANWEKWITEINYPVHIYPTPMQQAGHNTRSIFKQSLTGLNS